MAAKRKTLTAVMSGTADTNIRFGDLCALLCSLGFAERIKGDHHIFTHADVLEIINLQPLRGGKAKPYQVRQVRGILLMHPFLLRGDRQ